MTTKRIDAPPPGDGSTNGVSGLRRVRGFYDRAARTYDQWLGLYERVMGTAVRRRHLLSRARGRTLEVGVGTGRNIADYPAETDLTGVDISRAMLQIAEARATRLGRAVELRIGDAQNLDFPDGSFDTVAAILFLSAVPDQHRAISEIRRVLRPGGLLLVLDHARSTVAPVRWLQRPLNPVVARFARWEFMRNPLDDVTSAGFSVEEHERSGLGTVEELVARR
jgi:ubiquinone/menaquinone biosynthesis C-methylase UbiE